MEKGYIKWRLKNSLSKPVVYSVVKAYKVKQEISLGLNAYKQKKQPIPLDPNLDAFQNAKKNIGLLKIEPQYRDIFCKAMDDFSAYFSAHPEITMDVNATFNKFLYGYGRLKIVEDNKYLEKDGAVASQNSLLNKISMHRLDKANEDKFKENLIHEFTHFLIHQTYDPNSTKEYRLWVDEMMTEKFSKQISGVDFSTAYDPIIEMGNFLDSYLSKIRGEVFKTNEFLNNNIYPRLTQEENDVIFDLAMYDLYVSRDLKSDTTHIVCSTILCAKLNEMPNLLQGNATPEQLAEFVKCYDFAVDDKFLNTTDFDDALGSIIRADTKGVTNHQEIINNYATFAGYKGKYLSSALSNAYDAMCDLRNAETLSEKKEAQEKLNSACNEFNEAVLKEKQIYKEMNNIITSGTLSTLERIKDDRISSEKLLLISKIKDISFSRVVVVGKNNILMQRELERIKNGQETHGLALSAARAQDYDHHYALNVLGYSLQDGESCVIVQDYGLERKPMAEIKKIDGELYYSLLVRDERDIALMGIQDNLYNMAEYEVFGREEERIAKERELEEEKHTFIEKTVENVTRKKGKNKIMYQDFKYEPEDADAFAPVKPDDYIADYKKEVEKEKYNQGIEYDEPEVVLPKQIVEEVPEVAPPPKQIEEPEVVSFKQIEEPEVVTAPAPKTQVVQDNNHDNVPAKKPEQGRELVRVSSLWD